MTPTMVRLWDLSLNARQLAGDRPVMGFMSPRVESAYWNESTELPAPPLDYKPNYVGSFFGVEWFMDKSLPGDEVRFTAV
jgi:hypothetical protein